MALCYVVATAKYFFHSWCFVDSTFFVLSARDQHVGQVQSRF